MAEPIPVTQLSIACHSPWAIVHAACPQGPIFQAWDCKSIFCPCACHVDRNPYQIPEEIAKADTELTRASDLVLRPGLEPREHGFIKSVLELRALLDEAGILGEDPIQCYLADTGQLCYDIDVDDHEVLLQGKP